MNKIVAIDGPAGSGKGTVAKKLANDCNLLYIDTGAMYRAVAYKVLKNNIDLSEEDKIVELAKNSKIEFINGKTYLDGKDISDAIRSMEVSKIVSPVSGIVKLREILVDLQRKMAIGNDVIMEGRDITTVVFPNANYKFYLDADVNERANRRYKENQEKGIDASYEEILENIKKRDYNDMHKEIGALKKAEDAIVIDCSEMSVEKMVQDVLEIINEKRNK